MATIGEAYDPHPMAFRAMARVLPAAIDTLTTEIHENAVEKGFWPDGCSMGEKIALMHAELSEWLEALRRRGKAAELAEKFNQVLGDPDDPGFANQYPMNQVIRDGAGQWCFRSEHIPVFTAEEEEAADVIIRVLDVAGAFRMRVGEAILAKMAFNAGRPHKHGKDF